MPKSKKNIAVDDQCLGLQAKLMTRVEFHFDDFKVTHVKSPVIVTNNYYPFAHGLSSDILTRKLSKENLRVKTSAKIKGRKQRSFLDKIFEDVNPC